MHDTAVHWPAWAYVPGRTERHADGAFDTIRATACLGMSPRALALSAAMRHGFAYAEARFFWEAHEVLEPVWMALPNGSAERDLVQGLIQTVNGLLKIRMDRPKAARRLSKIAGDLIRSAAPKAIPEFEPARVRAIYLALSTDQNLQNNA